VFHDVFEVVLGQHHQAVARDAEALGPQLQLLHRLFPGDIEDWPKGGGDLAGELQQERRLADAGIPADQDQGTRDDPTTQDLVKLPHG